MLISVRRWALATVLLLLSAPVLAQSPTVPRLGNWATSNLGNTQLPAARSSLGITSVELQDPINGGAADAVVTPITIAAGATSFSGQTGTPSAGQTLVVPGIGANGSPFITTFTNTTTLAAGPTYATGTFYGSDGAFTVGGNCPIVTAGGSVANPYTIGDVLTVSGGTPSTPSKPTQCTIDYVSVVAAAINAAGSGGTNGTCTIQGTTGTTPTKWQGTVTVSGGAMTGAITVILNGAYSAMPTLTGEPVSGCGLVGATVNLGTGDFHAYRSQDGNYSVSPIGGGGAGNGTVSTTDSGSGTGATLSMTYQTAGATITQSDNNVRGPTYGTDNVPALTTIAALSGNNLLLVPKGAYLFASCAQITFHGNLTIQGFGPDHSTWILADECTPLTSAHGWLTWSVVRGTWGRVRDLTIDLRSPVKTTTPGWNALYFNGVRGQVNNTHILNAAAWINQIGEVAGSGNAIVDTDFSGNYLTAAGDHQPMQCILLSTSSGTIDKSNLNNNICIGSGFQIDGTNFVANANNTSSLGFGTGIFTVSTGSVGQLIGNFEHDSLLRFDVNLTPAGGIENDAANVKLLGNKVYNVGGAGIVNFGTNVDIIGNDAYGSGKAFGQGGTALNYKLQEGIRLPNSGQARVIGNTATDDGSGDMVYGYSEDPGGSLANIVTLNSFNGATAPANITSAATTGSGWDAKNSRFGVGTLIPHSALTNIATSITDLAGISVGTQALGWAGAFGNSYGMACSSTSGAATGRNCAYFKVAATDNASYAWKAENGTVVLGAMSGSGHFEVGNNAPVLTSCGGSPAIVGDDKSGEVTMGTTATGCIITFKTAYTGVPICAVTWQATPLASQSYSVTASAITTVQTSTSNNKLDYVCHARSGG